MVKTGVRVSASLGTDIICLCVCQGAISIKVIVLMFRYQIIYIYMPCVLVCFLCQTIKNEPSEGNKTLLNNIQLNEKQLLQSIS